MAIRLVRLFTGDDGESHFTDGRVELGPSDAPSAGSAVDGAATVSFEESASGSSLSWHNAPERQYVITLSGTLEFETRLGGVHDRAGRRPPRRGHHRWRSPMAARRR
jgi:hypothetical protein